MVLCIIQVSYNKKTFRNLDRHIMLAQGYNFIIIIAHDARYKHRTNVTVVSINQLIATYDLVQFWPSLSRNAMLWGECNVVLQREGQNWTAITCIL